MIFDQQYPVAMGEFLAAPEWPFADPPKSPDQIKQTIILGGSNTGTQQSIAGQADEVEE